MNVSLDTLDADTFDRLTRRDRLADVLAGVGAARAAGLDPVKINAVLMRGVNDHEAPALAALGDPAKACNCGSSSRCRWTPSTPGSAPRW